LRHLRQTFALLRAKCPGRAKQLTRRRLKAAVLLLC
jgi:hypothetical protein